MLLPRSEHHPPRWQIENVKPLGYSGKLAFAHYNDGLTIYIPNSAATKTRVRLPHHRCDLNM